MIYCELNLVHNRALNKNTVDISSKPDHCECQCASHPTWANIQGARIINLTVLQHLYQLSRRYITSDSFKVRVLKFRQVHPLSEFMKTINSFPWQESLTITTPSKKAKTIWYKILVDSNIGPKRIQSWNSVQRVAIMQKLWNFKKCCLQRNWRAD